MPTAEDRRRGLYQFGERPIVILWNSLSLKTALFTLFNMGRTEKYRRVRSRRVGADLTRLLPNLTTSMEKLVKHPIPTEIAQFALQGSGAQVADSFPEYRVAA